MTDKDNKPTTLPLSPLNNNQPIKCMSKKLSDDTIVHNIYDYESGFLHSISVNGVESKRVSYKAIARKGRYGATTRYYKGYLPAIFKLDTPVEYTVNKKGNTKHTTPIV